MNVRSGRRQKRSVTIHSHPTLIRTRRLFEAPVPRLADKSDKKSIDWKIATAGYLW